MTYAAAMADKKLEDFLIESSMREVMIWLVTDIKTHPVIECVRKTINVINKNYIMCALKFLYYFIYVMFCLLYVFCINAIFKDKIISFIIALNKASFYELFKFKALLGLFITGCLVMSVFSMSRISIKIAKEIGL